ncbi:unnamed protein product [Cylindrotheca closterium]|uniref:BSD domain-containing protein n=1 Tax=Cylindrotheca closterium TaxID=2856 RepID=A0AAD2FMW1_9STRA|nr:unnamed protein product [Cylindrotheca closterium]
MYFTTIRTRALCEQERRRNQSSTFTEPLPISSPLSTLPAASQTASLKPPSSSPEDELKSFLEEFNQPVVTPEQKAKNEKEMEEHPILKVHFEMLVPKKIVSYEDFWQRYYHRCYDLNRIVSELQQQDKQQEQQGAKDLDSDPIGDKNPKHQQSIPPSQTFKSVQDRIFQMTSSPARQDIEKKEEPNKDDKDTPNLETTFDSSSLSFGSASFNVIPIEAQNSTTQSLTEATSEMSHHDYLPSPWSMERQMQYENHENGDDSSSFGSLVQMPNCLSEVTSVVTNPDQIHRYPESPDYCDHVEEEVVEHSTAEALEQAQISDTASTLDDRLSGASIFLLNDDFYEQNDKLVDMIVAMGGKITLEMMEATHALWIPPPKEAESLIGNDEQKQKQESWEDFRENMILWVAESYKVPILDSDKWLPRIARLEFEEDWSDVNCEDFHPGHTQAKTVTRSSMGKKVVESPKEATMTVAGKQSKTQSTSNNSSTQRQKILSFAKVALLLTMVLLLLTQWHVVFPTKTFTPNLSISKEETTKYKGWPLFRSRQRIPAQSSSIANGQMKTNVQESRWNKILSKIKVRRQRQIRE